MRDGAAFSPVELYLLEDRYYVVDGHHRVAAARSLGQLYVDALVTEFRPMPSTADRTPAGGRAA
jgi:hypothetical protein